MMVAVGFSPRLLGRLVGVAERRLNGDQSRRLSLAPRRRPAWPRTEAHGYRRSSLCDETDSQRAVPEAGAPCAGSPAAGEKLFHGIC